MTRECVKEALKILVDNGVDKDEAETVLQAVGYALLNMELFPEKAAEDAPINGLSDKTTLMVTIDTHEGTCVVEEHRAEPATYPCSMTSLEDIACSAGEAVSDYLQGLG